MRALRALLAACGLMAGLVVCAAMLVIDFLRAEPVRINFGYVGDDDISTAIMVDPSALTLAIAITLAGAVAGWAVGLIATRRGWALARRPRD